jgi:arsenate reductase (thioredoxin)
LGMIKMGSQADLVLPARVHGQPVRIRVEEGQYVRGGSTVLADYQRADKERTMMKILFLCTGNSCRSQMAEGWARALKRGVLEPYSAGVETHGLNPRAVRAMAEAGVDISGHRSKNVAELMTVDFDCVVTVCGHADEVCPAFPGKTRVVHVGFDDPPALAKTAKTEEEAMAHYRRVRDEIKAFVESLPEGVKRPPS